MARDSASTTLEATLWAVDGAEDFGEAVLRAANLGDDADTTAAIAGQLTGARWGASGIRASWVEKVALAPRLIEMARQLFRAGGGEIVGSGPVSGPTTSTSTPTGSVPISCSPARHRRVWSHRRMR